MSSTSDTILGWILDHPFSVIGAIIVVLGAVGFYQYVKIRQDELDGE